MAKVVARNAVIFGGGRDVSGRSNNATLSRTAEAPEATGFGETTVQRLSGGIRDHELALDGFYDSAASQVDALYSSLVGGSAVWGLYPSTAGASKRGSEFVGIVSNYEQKYAVADAAAVSVTVSGCSPYADVMSLGYATVTGTASAVLSSCSVDFAGSATNTWGFLHLITLTGTTPEISACLQDSSDDAAFTTIIAFTTASVAGTAQAIQHTAAAGASRYRRLKYIMAGTSPCATLAVSSGS